MSFEDGLRIQAQRLVAPRLPHPDAPAAIATRVRGKRHTRRGIIVGVITTVITVSAATAWSRSGDDVQVAAARPMNVDVRAQVGGVEVEFKVGFDDARAVDSTAVTTGGRAARSTGYFPLDGSDTDQNFPEPLPLAAGTRIDVYATVLPSCNSREPNPVVLEVRSHRGNGDLVIDRFLAANTDDIERATHAYCAKGVQIQGGASKSWPDGRAEFLLFATNPTGEPVTVRSEPYTRGRSRWQPASVLVPPRSTRKLIVRSTNALNRNCPQNTPWTTRHLTVNGKPVALAQEENGCE